MGQGNYYFVFVINRQLIAQIRTTYLNYPPQSGPSMFQVNCFVVFINLLTTRLCIHSYLCTMPWLYLLPNWRDHAPLLIFDATNLTRQSTYVEYYLNSFKKTRSRTLFISVSSHRAVKVSAIRTSGVTCRAWMKMRFLPLVVSLSVLASQVLADPAPGEKVKHNYQVRQFWGVGKIMS